jgi:hypothetical protein
MNPKASFGNRFRSKIKLDCHTLVRALRGAQGATRNDTIVVIQCAEHD